MNSQTNNFGTAARSRALDEALARLGGYIDAELEVLTHVLALSTRSVAAQEHLGALAQLHLPIDASDRDVEALLDHALVRLSFLRDMLKSVPAGADIKGKGTYPGAIRFDWLVAKSARSLSECINALGVALR